MNAALKIKGEEPMILRRMDGYIGTLIDDLVTKARTSRTRIADLALGIPAFAPGRTTPTSAFVPSATASG